MITLASDFGAVYPAAMKGVLLSHTDADLVDIAHDLPRQNPRAAAFWLQFALSEFPPAVHLIVVDPGVGTDRRAIVVRSGEHAFVGPDNGVLLPPARVVNEKPIEAFEITDVTADSMTFHGRDVFAPMAALVHEYGVGDLTEIECLKSIDDPIDITFPTPTLSGDGTEINATVLVVDDFGNLITNVPGEKLANYTDCLVNGHRVPIVDTFASVPTGEPLVTVGSHGYVECDVNHGRGDVYFAVSVGETVSFEILDR